MDLFEQLSEGRADKALDRLEALLALFESETEIEQDLALERVIAYCDREWGSYAAGLEALADRCDQRSSDPSDAARSLILRQEGGEPGAMIKSIRQTRLRQRGRMGERDAIIAQYGGEEQVSALTPLERRYVEATAHLAEEGASGDPFGVLAGWHLAWHDLPDLLRQAVSMARPLPTTIRAARDECLDWEERLRHLDLVFDCDGAGVLPTACAARRKVVEDLWRRGLRASGMEDLSARLQYWASRGGDDGVGYGVLLDDLRVVSSTLAQHKPSQSTKDRARALKSEHPDWSLARIGKVLGISRQAVHKHLKGFVTPV